MQSRNFIMEYIWIWVKALILFAIGGFVLGGFTSGGFDAMWGFMVAAVVFGFAFFNKVVPFNLFGNSDAVIWFWIIKLFASLIIGIIAFPIVNIYYIVRIIISIIKK